MRILKKRADFLRVAGAQSRVVTHHCVVQCAYPAHESESQFGFTATKRLGGAIVRNRTKRRMKAAVQHILREGPIPHADYVLIGRNSTQSCPYTELLRDLRYAFKKGRARLEGLTSEGN